MEFPHGGAGGVWVDNQNVEKGKVRDWAAHVEGLLREIREGAPEALDTFIEVAQVLQDNENELASLITTLAQKLDASQYTAEDVLAKLRAVDGAGSGLDADLLGGVASTQYAKITDIPNYQDPDLSSIDAARLNGADASFYRNASNLNAGTVPHARLPRATQAEAEGGASHSTLMTPYRTKQAVDNKLAVLGLDQGGRQDIFVSGPQTIVPAGFLQIAHGLGYRPAIITGLYELTEDDSGYLTGDKIYHSPNSSAAGEEAHGYSAWADESNISIRFGRYNSSFTWVIHGTGGGWGRINPNNARLWIVATGRL